MRKLIFSGLIISSLLFLSTCDLFSPGLGKGVDVNPPFLFVTSHQNGAYVSGLITVSGNFEEDVATASVGVSVDGGANYLPATLDQPARTWTINIDTALVTDGEKDVIFHITDTSGKMTEKKILLYFDNTAPLIIMTAPSTYGMTSPAYYGSAFYIRGEAADTFGLTNVTLQVWDVTEATLLLTVTATGTNTWAYPLNSPTYIPTTGTLKFTATATDRAGNVSLKFYHMSDIITAFGGNIAIDEVYKYYTGQPGFDSGAFYTYLQANGTNKVPLYFDQDSNKPTIEVYNPDGTGAANNVFMSTSRLSGKAMDEDSIAANSVEVMITRTTVSPGLVQDWISTGNIQSTSVNWQYFLTGLPTYIDADYEVSVRATDMFGNQRVLPTPLAFRIDSGAPALVVTQPTQGQYINGNFTISGTATDAQGIFKVEVSTNDGATWNDATGTESWSYNVTTPTEGSMLIKVKAWDNTGKSSIYNLQVIIDKTSPTASFLNPAFSSTVNGLVLIRGTSSDNTQITNAEIRIGKVVNWIPMSNYYNWEYEIDSTNYANLTYADDMGGGVWRLYIYARITDRAGNQYTKSDYYFLIDNDTDKPNVSILAPQAGATIGGSTTVSGTAVDDDGLYRVYMSMDLDNNGLYTSVYNLNGNGTTGGSQVGTVAGLPIGNPAELFENEAYWYELSGTTQWSVPLNGNGELYHINGQNGEITIRVVAVDSKDGGVTPGIKGNNQVRSFRFDDTIPGFENMSHDSNSFVRKTFTLTGRAVDDQHVDKIEISYNGGVNWTTVYDPPSTPWINTYNFSIPINTETVNGGVFANSSGILYLRLRAIDNTGYTKLQLIDLKVDNSYPTSDYSGSLSDIYGATANSFVQGTTTDSGTVSGTKQVEVYFMRGSTVYNPRTPGSTTLSTVDLGDGSGPVYYTADPTYKIVIDQKYENGLSDLDGDTFKETFTVQGNNTLWSTQFNSLLISDGAVTIHYVAVDYALNKRHYQTAAAPAGAFIKNYKPVVTGLTVGSDVDFSNVVDGDELYAYSLSTYSSSNRFKARNRLLLTVTASDPGGTVPGITNYNFFREGVSVQSGASATLNTTVAGYPQGNTYFTCVITDGDSITTTTDTFWIFIDKTDSTNPTIGIDEFDADGNPDNNLVDGHIELPVDSRYNNGLTNGDGVDDDADVSGIILLKGTAWDNFYINSITLTLDGVGSNVMMAQWDSGPDTLVSQNSDFTIVSQDITPAGGHSVVWTYRWNTSTVTNRAGANKTTLFTVNDLAALNNVASKSYDVVPYISGLVRSIGAEGTTRSKYGNFTLQQGESNLTLTGYNLDKNGTYGTNSWVRVYNTAGTLNDQVANAKVTPNGSYTSLTISDLAEITNSGWLRIMVNNVEATNNINDNTKINNKEDDGNGLGSTLWTDDRYVRVWQVGTSMSASSNANYPAMSIDSAGAFYGSWTDYTTAASVFYGTTAAATPIFQMYDPAEYSDIHIDSSNNITVVYLGNYYGGSGWDYNSGTAGAVSVWTSGAPQQVRRGFGYPWNNFHRFEMLYHDAMLLQFQRPKVVRTGNNIHVAYYDIDTNSVKYGYVATTSASTGENGWLNIDGGSDAHDVRRLTGVGTRPLQNRLVDTALIGNTLIVAGQEVFLTDTLGNTGLTTVASFVSGSGTVNLNNNIDQTYLSYSIVTTTSNLVTQGATRSGSAGTYVAIEVDEQGYPVILYYDISNQTLKLARATSATPNAPADWYRQTVFQAGDPNKNYVGQHPSLKFDATGILYAVCYRISTGDLIYLSAPDADSVNYSFALSTIIDSEGAVGAWADISLNGTTPYISYLNSSMIGTFNGLKLAYWNSARGAWEWEIAPLSSPISENRTSIEYKKGAVTWTAAIGYKGTAFDIILLKPEE